MRDLARRADRLLYWLIVLQVGAIVVTVNLQVFNRYVLDYVLGWEEEVSRYLMIWSSFLAASYALWQGEQLGMEFVVSRLPARWRRAVRIGTHLLVIGFLGVVAYQGFVWMLPQQIDQVSPSLGITMAVPYAAIPVSALMMIWVECRFIRQALRDTPAPAATGSEPLPL